MANKTNGIDSAAGWARAPPPPGNLRQRIAKAIYNPEEKSFLGRTPKKWGIVLIFYIIFYIVLAALFTICMLALLMQLDDDKPMYTLSQSLIGSNPGVAYRPLPANGALKYKADNVSHYEDYINELKEFLAPYESEGWYPARKECKPEDDFGFPNTPCLYIKLNKIYGWKPEYYDDVGALPEIMPPDLKQYVEGLQPVEVWISCTEEGSNATKIEYPWGRGLPGRFYPYTNHKGYKSPLVAVKLVPPMNTEVIIRCWAWAKNIIHNKSIKDPSGYTRIALTINDDSAN